MLKLIVTQKLIEMQSKVQTISIRCQYIIFLLCPWYNNNLLISKSSTNYKQLVTFVNIDMEYFHTQDFKTICRCDEVCNATEF